MHQVWHKLFILNCTCSNNDLKEQISEIESRAKYLVSMVEKEYDGQWAYSINRKQ